MMGQSVGSAQLTATRTEPVISTLIHSMIPAEPGWRAVLQRTGPRHPHDGRWLPYVYHDGDWRPFPEVDVSAVPTERLGYMAPIIAWALVEEWADDIAVGYEPWGWRQEDSRGYSRWIDPIYVDGAETHGGDKLSDLPIDLLAPGRAMTDDELRQMLIDCWRGGWERS